jgi:Uncharacterized protein encoded in toxicity protection region of plasmid R478, contains von Willebrand factor (vWF) domain
MIEQETKDVQPSSGTLLGVVLDLSGSMQSSMANKDRKSSSRIENLSKAFTSVVENVQLLTRNIAVDKQMYLRLFVHGFGFMNEDAQYWQSPIGDVFSVITSLDEHIAQYRPLQAELETLWNDEIAHTLEEKRIIGDAKDDLCRFVEKELREQAIHAAQQRSAARFQHWCISVCQSLDVFDVQLRNRVTAQNKYLSFLLWPLALGFLWLLKGPARLLNFTSQVFERWLQRKLANLRENAHIFATQQSEKVVQKTQEALSKNRQQIASTIEGGITGFIDTEAYKFIRLYDSKNSITIQEQAFDKATLKVTYEQISNQIAIIMSPHANVAWKTSIALFKAAARALKITPNWAILKEKTILCAHQVVWETAAPEVKDKAQVLAKERFTRAVLITIAQKTKDKRTTLTLGEIAALVKHSEEVHIAANALPIFGASPMGQALRQTFLRLQEEAHLPQNKGLRPAIVIISDGLPTDKNIVDPYLFAGDIKRRGIPIVCCFVTDRNVGRPWLLPHRTGWFWSEAAKLMFALSSDADEWPQLSARLKDSRFVLKSQSKLFVQINHAEYLQNFIEALLFPTEKEIR